MPDSISLIDLLTRSGAVALLATALVGAIREWWVPGATHRRLLAESYAREQEWKQMALEGIRVTERAVKVAAQNVP